MVCDEKVKGPTQAQLVRGTIPSWVGEKSGPATVADLLARSPRRATNQRAVADLKRDCLLLCGVTRVTCPVNFDSDKLRWRWICVLS